MNRTDTDRLLHAIDAAKTELLGLDNASTHFVMGAFYGLHKAEQVIRATEREHPTCLIDCRQAREE